MADNGKLEKMLILAFETSADAESGGKPEAKDSVEALITPRPTRWSTRSRPLTDKGRAPVERRRSSNTRCRKN